MNGIDALRNRRQRQVPAPRKPQNKAAEPEATPAAQESPPTVQSAADDQIALGVMVPRSLDRKLVGLTVQLRLQGLEVTRADLVALALADLPDEPTPRLCHQLRLIDAERSNRNTGG